MEIIHIVLGKANPERMNGVNKVVFGMASKQMHFGEKVVVWGITKDKIKNYEDRNFETKLFLRTKNPFGISTELKKAIIEKKDQAVFHFHGGWIPVYYSLSKLMSKNNIPFVFTPHGAYNTVAMKKNKWIKKIYYHLFEKNVLERSNKIHCLGQSEITGLSKLYTSNKTVLLPYGYENNTSITLNDLEEKDQFIFGFIGRLDIYTKGLDKLIDGFERFIKIHPNGRLWIIGDSSEKELLQKMITEKKLNNHIILFGSKFGKHKETLLKNIDVFVHPSRNEGLPASIIEAASYGKPCLVSYATNIGDLIQDYNAGKMIKKVTSKQIEKAMLELYEESQNSKSYIKMQQNAVRMIKENFNWNKIIHDYKVQLYQNGI